MAKPTRRDFLKLMFLAGLEFMIPGPMHNLSYDHDRPNIIIILFDAMSASNMSLYGYPRETTPHLTRFAERSVVYHNHYSGGNFTTPGTASMLSGMFQWKHRALSHGGLVQEELAAYNLFSLLGDDYFRLMFSQNLWPDRLVSQYYGDVERFLPITSFSLRGNHLVMDKMGKERYLASIVFDEFLFRTHIHVPGSALFGYLNKSLALNTLEAHRKHPDYATGVPEVEGIANYLNEDIYKGVLNEIIELEAQQKPYFSYFHLYSPHAPYKPSRKYARLFRNDGYIPKSKPQHPYGSGWDEEELLTKRIRYDRQIAHVDAEFGNLIEQLDIAGVLDDSYIILTSDHGEMFERGFAGHGEPLMYEPGVKIPLLIHAPRQTTRQDVQVSTSNVDLLPTVLSIVGKPLPSILDGQVLPGIGGAEDSERSLFSMYAVENSQFSPITKAAICMHKGRHKLIAYLGYDLLDGTYELYDLENDPEEMQNLVETNPDVFAKLREELLERLADANRPFLKDIKKKD